MRFVRLVLCSLAGIFLAGGLAWAAGKSPNTVMSTPPVYLPDLDHPAQSLPSGVLAWDQTTKSLDVPDGQAQAKFVFNFTNVDRESTRTAETNLMRLPAILAVTNSGFWHVRISFVTNYTTVTNISWITNSAPAPVTIVSVHPTCGCTTAKLPPMPWTLAPGAHGQIHLVVNVQGRIGTLFKTVNVTTDKGYLTLMMRINMLPPAIPTISEAERARDLAVAKIDRQAVFRNDCAKCHVRNVAGKYGQALYDSVCAICHNAAQRASFVPDLHTLKTPANEQFWQSWIASGKPGTLMPAFAAGQGGPLNDVQVASLAAFLDHTIPSAVPPAPPANSPRK